MGYNRSKQDFSSCLRLVAKIWALPSHSCRLLPSRRGRSPGLVRKKFVARISVLYKTLPSSELGNQRLLPQPGDLLQTHSSPKRIVPPILMIIATRSG
jgi:hypothetical protein